MVLCVIIFCKNSANRDSDGKTVPKINLDKREKEQSNVSYFVYDLSSV